MKSMWDGEKSSRLGQIARIPCDGHENNASFRTKK